MDYLEVREVKHTYQRLAGLHKCTPRGNGTVPTEGVLWKRTNVTENTNTQIEYCVGLMLHIAIWSSTDKYTSI